MRVAIFTETYLPYINGVVTHVKILKEGLESKGHQVLIITADVNAGHHYIEDGILRCPAKEFKSLYGYGVAFPISNTRQSMIAQFAPDIIHIHNEFGVGLTGVRAAKRLGVPLVYTLHTLYDDYIYYISPKHLTGATKRISHKYMGFLGKRADVLTGPSKKCADYFAAIGINKPVYIIPNSVETELFNPVQITPAQRAEVRERYNIPADAFLCCFIGRLGKEKAIDVLLEMWKNTIRKDDNMRMMIVGDGPFKEEFMELATELGIADQVIFTGAIPHEQLPPYFAACDVYLTASLSEMYSISMLEAMASGLPVVQKLDPDNIDQIKSGVNGFIYQDEQEMARILREIKSLDSDRRAALTASVIESVKERNSDGIASYMLELYGKAIAERSAQ